MKKLKILAMVPALIALSCVLIVPNAQAGKCKELESAMMYSEAAKCYHDATVATPMNPENHYLLGLVYLKQGNDRWLQDLAQKSFIRAVALDAQQNARINPSLQYLDYSSLNDVREQLDAVATKNPSIKKKLATDVASRGRDRLVREDFAEAKNLFDFALRYSPEMRPEIFSFISSAGERSGSRNTYTYFHLALSYASTNAEREAIGKNFLRLAVQHWPNNSHKELKEKAEEILGKNKVLEAFPLPYDAVVFDRTYTFDDAYDKVYGQINTINFAADKVNVGDRIVIEAMRVDGSLLNGKEVYYWRGKNFDPKWGKTTMGKYSVEIEAIGDPSKFFVINLAKQKDLMARVYVVRKVTPKPTADKIN